MAALAVLSLPAFAGEDVVGAAERAAAEWLALVDEAKYGASWDEGSSRIRETFTREDWEQSVRSARAPLGALRWRKIRSTTFATTLPGVPDPRQYVVIQYDARFEHKAAALETVTPMREPNGAWKVSEYDVR